MPRVPLRTTFRTTFRRAGLAAAVLALVASGTAAAAPGASGDHATMYYVSVGDSLAAGVQPTGDPDDMDRTDQGYAEQLLQIARADSPKLKLVKLGCPGETTTTLIEGGICSYPHGSQLDEAVSFLRAHRAMVAFVTIDIGPNDFPCYEPDCVVTGVGTISTNLPKILAALRGAAGPDVPIAGMTIYNPFLGYWLTGPDGQAYARYQASPLMSMVNNLLRSIYEANGVVVADIEGAFSSYDFTTLVTLPGAGEVPINVAKICMWTWVCAPPPEGPNNHANAAGYGVIAAAFAVVLGL